MNWIEKREKRTIQWSRVLLLTHPLVLCGWNHADLTSLDSIFLTCQVGIIHTLQGTHTYIHDTHTLQGLLCRSSQRATVSSTEKCAFTDMSIYGYIKLWITNFKKHSITNTVLGVRGKGRTFPGTKMFSFPRSCSSSSSSILKLKERILLATCYAYLNS